MDPRASNDRDQRRSRAPTRGDRQRAEILALVAARHLHRAADLAHEHLAEFPDDHIVRHAVLAALETCADPQLRRRATEFPAR